MDDGFEDLARRHMPDAYRFCLLLAGNSADAEELAQEGIARAFQGFGGFRGEASFRTWLFSILLRCHQDVLRRRSRWLGRQERLARPAAVPHEGFDEVAAGDLRASILRRMQDLPPRQREVLSLHSMDGLDYREIARVLGISYDDVKVNLSLARKRLKELLK